MQKVPLSLLISGIFLAVVGGWYFSMHDSSNPVDLSRYTILEKTVEGVSMTPLIQNGQKIRLIIDFYKDNLPEVGDIISYHYGGNRHLLIKQVRATSEERVAIVDDTLEIDGDTLENSAGETYHFTPGEIKLLGLYVHTGHIPDGSYLIFGDNVTDSVDSRKFGAVAKTNFGGKFLEN